MKSVKPIIPIWILLAVHASAAVSFDKNIPQLVFAAGEIAQALKDQPNVDVILRVKENLAEPQGYEIKVDGKNKAEVIGADAVGAMYGGLEIAEKIRIGMPLINSKHQPHIAQRSEERRVGKEC